MSPNQTQSSASSRSTLLATHLTASAWLSALISSHTFRNSNPLSFMVR